MEDRVERRYRVEIEIEFQSYLDRETLIRKWAHHLSNVGLVIPASVEPVGMSFAALMKLVEVE